jgi:hypothetical protein
MTTLPGPFENANPSRFGAWELPFKPVDDPPTTRSVAPTELFADEVTVATAVLDGPLGTVPALVFNFSSSAGGPPAPGIVFVGDEHSLKAFARLTGQAVDLAVQTMARRRKGRP